MTKIGKFWPYSAELIPEDEIFFSENFLWAIFYADSKNGLKIVIFEFFVKMTKIPIFDFESLKLRKGRVSFHINIISSIFRVYAIT